MPEVEKCLFADGVFDMFHSGHVAFLQQAHSLATSLGLVLLVGIISDEDAASYKRIPVLSLTERSVVVESCRYVHKVVRGSPLIIDGQFLDNHCICAVVHGDDSPQATFFEEPIKRGIMRYVPYTRGISTSDLLHRICQRFRVEKRSESDAEQSTSYALEAAGDTLYALPVRWIGLSADHIAR